MAEFMWWKLGLFGLACFVVAFLKAVIGPSKQAPRDRESDAGRGG